MVNKRMNMRVLFVYHLEYWQNVALDPDPLGLSDTMLKVYHITQNNLIKLLTILKMFL